jgi:hypothetical protein
MKENILNQKGNYNEEKLSRHYRHGNRVPSVQFYSQCNLQLFRANV